MEIKQFMGPFRFLSNFYPSEITHNGIAYPTVEHFYQAMKCVDKNEAFAIANAATPVQAKRMGRKVKIRPDWESIKEQIMGFALWEKFKNPNCAKSSSRQETPPSSRAITGMTTTGESVSAKNV